jgi:5-methylcytosine-specific restriction endonuclease McrA
MAKERSYCIKLCKGSREDVDYCPILSKPNVASPKRRCTVKAERGARCEICGRDDFLDLHHIKARRYGGKDTKENAQLLCEPCHVQTPTYGDHSRLQ